MNSTRRSSLRGTIGIMLIMILIPAHLYIFNINEAKYTELKELNNTLNTTLNEQVDLINKLEQKNTDLNTCVSQLEEDNKSIKEENEKLKEENKKLQESSVIKSTNKKDFKSYMSYTAITNKSSAQWKLQQRAYTDKNGLRCIDGKPIVAIGTGWGLSVGDSALITCDNGNSFKVVIGDIKDNAHTLSDNKTTLANNCRCEFIVDVSQLNPKIKSSGNVSTLEQYSGYVTNIQKCS